VTTAARTDTGEMDAAPTHTSDIVIGTAGHVDHGKSTLVRALTGIDPDRLAEEKAREMTIDLGFAWVVLPSGRRAGIVDVPGHERFIKNMLAGVGGIDLALLVIASDEGPMPQTREHLAILDLLGIRQGVVALTKTDMVDGEMVELVAEEVEELLRGMGLAGSPIIPVSALSGQGLDDLRQALDDALARAEDAHQSGPARLPVDRVFSVQGFGTVVTGTVLGGSLSVGQDVVIMPGREQTRIRGIQSHNEQTTTVAPGNRAALNLASVSGDDIRRGDVVSVPGALRAATRVDCHVEMLPSAPAPLEQNDEIDFFSGAKIVRGWPTLLDNERIDPGKSGWVQFRLQEPVAVAKNDRFILRRPSPSETIGGGTIVDPAPARHKRFRPDVIAALETLAQGTPEDIVFEAVSPEPREYRELVRTPPAGLLPEQVAEAIRTLREEGRLVVLGTVSQREETAGFVLASDRWQDVSRHLRDAIDVFHERNPLRKGMPREEARRATGLQQRAFDAAVATAVDEGWLCEAGAVVHRADFSIVLDPSSRASLDRYRTALDSHPMSPPAPREFGIDDDLVAAAIELGEVVRVADGIVFSREAYESLVSRTLAHIDDHGSITLAGFRDRFGTSRKYAQAVLEYFDQQRVTRRVGDERRRFAVTSTPSQEKAE
jgi:selenocysteine-specific elongation factor